MFDIASFAFAARSDTSWLAALALSATIAAVGRFSFDIATLPKVEMYVRRVLHPRCSSHSDSSVCKDGTTHVGSATSENTLNWAALARFEAGLCLQRCNAPLHSRCEMHSNPAREWLEASKLTSKQRLAFLLQLVR
jgi:hypothetical protein